VQNKFNIGDLVQLKHYCRDSNRLAMVVDDKRLWADYCEIIFIDTGERENANVSNLELISENR
jgi:hypothetical protein